MAYRQPPTVFSDRDLGQIGSRVVASLLSGVLTEGPSRDELESSLRLHSGRRYAVSMATGGTALDVVMDLVARILHAKPDNRVRQLRIAIPSVAHWSAYSAAKRNGFVAAFAPVDPDGQLAIPLVVDRLGEQGLDAVLYVPIGGMVHPQLPDFAAACHNANVLLVCDMSQALGSVMADGRPAASFGDLTVASLHSDYIVTSGEGGVILTDSLEWSNTARALRDGGLISRSGDQHYDYFATDARMPELSASVGVVSLDTLASRIQARQLLAARYDAVLADTPGLRLVGREGSNLYKYLVTIFDEPERFEKEMMLREVSPAAKVYVSPVWVQGGVPGPSSDWVNAVEWTSKHVALPMHESLTGADADEIASRVREAALTVVG